MSLTTMLTTTAVYWAPSVPDGFGGWTFVTPVEIKCRIQVHSRRPPEGTDDSFTTDTIVYTSVPVSKYGWIWEGALVDIISADPQQCTGALRIKYAAESSTPDNRFTVYKAVI